MEHNDDIKRKREADERKRILNSISKLGKEYELKALQFLSEEEKEKELELKLYHLKLHKNWSWSEAANIANLLKEPMRTQELEFIAHRIKPHFREYQKILALMKRTLTSKEIIELLADYIERNRFDDASKAADLLPKKERDEWAKKNCSTLWDALYYCVEVRDFFSLQDALHIINLFHKSKKSQGLQKILDVVIWKGYLENALEIAKLLGRALTLKELEKVLSACIKRKDLRGVEKILELLDRAPTLDEELQILFLRNPNDWNIANRLPEPERTEELKKIFIFCTENKKTENAKIVADFLLKK